MVRLNRALKDTETLRSKAGSGIIKCGSCTRTEAPYAYAHKSDETKKTEKLEPPFMVRTPAVLLHSGENFEKILTGTDPSAGVRRLFPSATSRTSTSTMLPWLLRSNFALSRIADQAPL